MALDACGRNTGTRSLKKNLNLLRLDFGFTNLLRSAINR